MNTEADIIREVIESTREVIAKSRAWAVSTSDIDRCLDLERMLRTAVAKLEASEASYAKWHERRGE